jgi:predicted enzyme related to lactoylglutathione lyase
MAHKVVHVEIASTDPEAAGKFYGDLFGWGIHSAGPEMGNYVMWGDGEGGGGGFPAADEMYPVGSTLVYFGVDDIEATLARAEELGGKTLMPKTEIPGTGWFAIMSDTTGGRVALYTPMEQQQ